MGRRKHLSATELARALDADPFKYLCHRFNGLGDGGEKDKIALDLLPYCYPKMRSVEHKADTEGTVTITIGGGAPIRAQSPTVGDKGDA